MCAVAKVGVFCWFGGCDCDCEVGGLCEKEMGMRDGLESWSWWLWSCRGVYRRETRGASEAEVFRCLAHGVEIVVSLAEGGCEN